MVNPTEASHEFTPRIAGIKLRRNGKLSQIAPPDMISANEPDKEPAVKIMEIPQNTLPDSITAPPISVGIYEFDVE